MAELADSIYSWSASEGPVLRPLIRLALIGGLTANLAMAAVMCHISRMNYPGGQIGSTLAELSISNGSRELHPLELTGCR